MTTHADLVLTHDMTIVETLLIAERTVNDGIRALGLPIPIAACLYGHSSKDVDSLWTLKARSFTRVPSCRTSLRYGSASVVKITETPTVTTIHAKRDRTSDTAVAYKS